MYVFTVSKMGITCQHLWVFFYLHPPMQLSILLGTPLFHSPKCIWAQMPNIAIKLKAQVYHQCHGLVLTFDYMLLLGPGFDCPAISRSYGEAMTQPSETS